MGKILIVDDDKYLRKQIYWAFKKYYRLLEAENGEEALKVMKKNFVDLVLLDLHLPPQKDTPLEGIKVLKEIRKNYPEVVIIVITGDNEKKTALEAINLGAYDYFSKPFDLSEMKIILKRALYLQSLERENRRLSEELQEKYQFSNLIIGKSKKIQEVFTLIRRVAQSNCNVLIRGESGTGKELVARAIHYNSSRKDKPFVPVNCAALPQDLLESELFGYERGAFTGATSQKPGKFEISSGGTIFLDEVADMSLSMQAKILRVIQERVFERVGGTKSIKVDIRIIAATNKDLEKAVKNNSFRDDLYYRLNVVSIYIPPLRERREDIPLLANFFLKKYAKENKKQINGFSPEAMDSLMRYDWPGNVRELENIIEGAVVLGRSNLILREDLFLTSSQEVSSDEEASLPLMEQEKRLIKRILNKTGGNQTKAAKLLGIHRNTLRRKIKKYNLA
ncbi:PEP-CTERM-box response regulator transcription factor [Candidatus Aerophobetes bacterium]|nr:PEP-CTERM-box response regulator transcription factor [Candidatus Aerophobetes bacterium]